MNAKKEQPAAVIAAPFGAVALRCEGDSIVGVDYLPRTAREIKPGGGVAREAAKQIRAYFKNSAFKFDLPLTITGSDHQRKVWRAIAAIAAGKTQAYGDIAARLDSSPRAVGGACRANPLPLLIPCHRVVGKTGLGGFMGDNSKPRLEVKRWLLRHEGAFGE